MHISKIYAIWFKYLIQEITQATYEQSQGYQNIAYLTVSGKLAKIGKDILNFSYEIIIVKIAHA